MYNNIDKITYSSFFTVPIKTLSNPNKFCAKNYKLLFNACFAANFSDVI